MYISQIVKKWQSQKEGITESKDLEAELNKMIQQLSSEYRESHNQLSKNLPDLIQNLRKEKVEFRKEKVEFRKEKVEFKEQVEFKERVEFKEEYPEKIEKEIISEGKKKDLSQIEADSQTEVKIDYDWNKEIQEFTKGLFEQDEPYREVIDVKKKIPNKLNIKIEEKSANKQEKTKNNNSHFFVNRDMVDTKNIFKDENLNLETLVKTICAQDNSFNKKQDNINRYKKKRQKNNKKNK